MVDSPPLVLDELDMLSVLKQEPDRRHLSGESFELMGHFS
jgi:hypothetical protein